ncbi:uncharacterized protein TNCV_3053191 [Trichonephila clavipes]|uniref:Mutator-like transposase domain-containing protein n=1 Tax=Trichonephila clavipes TaxID=2585209 RepID=A0A8X6V9C4_TRICX|nr:uncharacterized protein TNCV_3053191 [Trichonephila clavipes]
MLKLNLPRLTKTAYKNQEAKLLKVVQEVAEESMIKAATEIVEKQQNLSSDIVKCGISVDGTWQRRGYTSMNGCVAATSVDTGKVLDIEVIYVVLLFNITLGYITTPLRVKEDIEDVSCELGNGGYFLAFLYFTSWMKRPDLLLSNLEFHSFGDSLHSFEIWSKEEIRTATAGSDVAQSGRPIFDDFFQHLSPYIGNNTANVVFQMVKRLWLIRIDQ